MPSPDLRPYVDLTILDITPEQLTAASVELLAGRLPGWRPLEADVEVTLLEANAVIVSQLVYALNRIPGAVLETLLRLYGLDRSPGLPATTTITITTIDTLGHTIEAGTRFLLAADPDVDGVTFATDVELVIAPGDNIGTVAATATTVGATPNGTVAGTPVTCIDPQPVRTAVIGSTVGTGAGAEDGTAFLERAREVLARLTDTLVLPSHFTAEALGDPAVYRALTLDRYDADTDTADVNGHVTVAVAGHAGASLSGPAKTALLGTLEAKALASLTIHVIDPTLTAIDVEAVVHPLPGYDPAEVTGNVVAALTAYLDPDVWPWAGTVRRNELLALVDGVTGVDYVIDVLDAPAGAPIADIALTGPANLATAGGVTSSAA